MFEEEHKNTSPWFRARRNTQLGVRENDLKRALMNPYGRELGSGFRAAFGTPADSAADSGPPTLSVADALMHRKVKKLGIAEPGTGDDSLADQTGAGTAKPITDDVRYL